MKLMRLLRIGTATTVALTTACSTFVVGCATKAKQNLQGGKDSDQSHRAVICDPVPPPPQICDPVPPPHVDGVTFGFDSATMTPEAKKRLDPLIAYMKRCGKDKIRLEGHTCTVGAPAYNKALGLRRAEAAKAYMIEQGIAADRISTWSCGAERPLVPNDSPACRALNRCVTTDYQVVP